MTLKQTVIFYTDGGLYKGWAYLNKTTYYNEVVNWIRSGNYVKVDKVIVSTVNREYFHLNTYLSSLIKRSLIT